MGTRYRFKDPHVSQLGKLIRSERETKLKLTQDEMADTFGIAQASISAWENGLKRPSLPSLLKLRNAFGLTQPEFEVWLELAGHTDNGDGPAAA